MTATEGLPAQQPEAPQGACVIMAGGRGTRFWPVSRQHRPKQLLALGSERSLLRETFERVVPLFGTRRILVVTNEAQASETARELPELSSAHIIAEPVGRNTAACAALGIALAEKVNGSGPVALVPADHFIPDAEVFRDQLRRALVHASRTGQAVTFGITPYRPETGYGYIEVRDQDEGPLAGVRFVEKPDRQTAADYVASGRYLWNSGIFVWDSTAFAAALVRHLPSIAAALAEPLALYPGPQFGAALAATYADCPAVSIDVGIMEKLPAFAVFRAAFKWSDLGSWDVWGTVAADLPGENRGRATLYALDSPGNIVYAPGKTVALVGVENLIVADTPDALLICGMQDAQRIKELIGQLERDKRHDLL